MLESDWEGIWASLQTLGEKKDFCLSLPESYPFLS